MRQPVHNSRLARNILLASVTAIANLSSQHCVGRAAAGQGDEEEALVAVGERGRRLELAAISQRDDARLEVAGTAVEQGIAEGAPVAEVELLDQRAEVRLVDSDLLAGPSGELLEHGVVDS